MHRLMLLTVQHGVAATVYHIGARASSSLRGSASSKAVSVENKKQTQYAAHLRQACYWCSPAMLCTPSLAVRAMPETLAPNGSSRFSSALPMLPCPTISTSLPCHHPQPLNNALELVGEGNSPSAITGLSYRDRHRHAAIFNPDKNILMYWADLQLWQGALVCKRTSRSSRGPTSGWPVLIICMVAGSQRDCCCASQNAGSCLSRDKIMAMHLQGVPGLHPGMNTGGAGA